MRYGYQKNAESPKSEQLTARMIQKECDVDDIRQTSRYTKGNKPVPDNNMFLKKDITHFRAKVTSKSGTG